MFQDQFDKAIKDYATNNQFNVSAIPVHTHNGVDSPQVAVSDLENSSLYVAVNTIMLSPSQILALHTTPVTILPVFGTSNTGISPVFIVEGITAKIKYGGTRYTGANNLEFRYTDASGAKVTADITSTFIDQNADTFAHVAGVTTALTPVANSPIIVCVPTANPAAGNSKITLVVKYRIVSI